MKNYKISKECSRIMQIILMRTEQRRGSREEIFGSPKVENPRAEKTKKN